MEEEVVKSAETKAKPRKLNIRQMKFVKALVHEPTNQSEAVRKAGYTHSSPHVFGSQLVRKDNIRQALMKELESLDIPKKFSRNWNTVLDSGLNIDENDPKFDQRQQTILKAQDQIARLAGLEPPKEVSRTLTMTLDGILPQGEITNVQHESPALILNPSDSDQSKE